MPHTVQVAVDGAAFHFDKLYTYLVPGRLAGRVFPGSMVLVPFGRGSRARMAVVLACDAPPAAAPAKQPTGPPADAPAQTCLEDGPQPQRPPAAPRLKELYDAAPEDARLTPDLLRLVHFLHERTFCTWYEAVRAVIPYGAQYRAGEQDGRPVLKSALVSQTEPVYRLIAELPQKPRPTAKQQLAAELLGAGPQPLSALEKAGVSRAVLSRLCQKGVLEQGRAGRAAPQTPPPAGLNAQAGQDAQTGPNAQAAAPVTLTEEQQAACARLEPLVADGDPHAALLFGVTSSGKTMVFLRLIQKALDLGKTALVLVPEISLTPQMIRRLRQAFGGRVAVQHSGLNNTERLLQWRMIQQGGADIVVGTRSAVFAPLQNIGLIILDEEQEHTYRSESAPRFLAHDVAKQRAAQHGALVLFSSATPRLESYYAAASGRMALVPLRQRYGGRPLPRVQLVDMRAELAAGNPGEVSLPLARQLSQNLARGEQAILLLNRRGYRTVALCTACGKAVKCGSCSVPMVYHKAQHKLLCHYCGRTIAPPPEACPECGGALRYSGFGTQRVEEELAQLLPKARILRMDQDSTGQKNAHDAMLAAFARQEYDILLGTQMVAKGLDFEKVTLVGVLGLDSLLFSQSFRAYENVFSLITQVVGRSGRAERPGRALIQTVEPNHPVLALAASQNYEAFYQQEIAFRKLFLYPPFCAVCVAAFSGKTEADAAAAAARFGALLAQAAGGRRELPLRVLGPAPMNVLMVSDRYRYKLTIKCRGDGAFRALMGEVLARYSEEGLPAKASVTLDMNTDGD